MLVSKEQLRAIYKECPEGRIDTYLPLLNAVMEEYKINTPQRIRMFLAQVGHESGQLRYTEELASGKAYEGRKDLGNLTPGDGVAFKGRGLIQITGKSNYSLCSLDLDLPLLDMPSILAQPEPATKSAGWFWQNGNLNALCDAGYFKELTRRINGGLNGYDDRLMLYNRALEAIPE